MTSDVKTENCSNCGTVIGALETPFVWQGNIVCKACHSRLGNYVPDLKPATSSNVQLIEKTAKRWKGLIAIGYGIVAVGFILIVAAILLIARDVGGGVPQILFVVGLVGFIGGTGVAIFGRVRAWWEHG